MSEDNTNESLLDSSTEQTTTTETTTTAVTTDAPDYSYVPEKFMADGEPD